MSTASYGTFVVIPKTSHSDIPYIKKEICARGIQAQSAAAAMRTRKHENNDGQICPCYGRVTGNAMRQLQQTTPPVTKKGVKRAYKKSKERRKPR